MHIFFQKFKNRPFDNKFVKFKLPTSRNSTMLSVLRRTRAMSDKQDERMNKTVLSIMFLLGGASAFCAASSADEKPIWEKIADKEALENLDEERKSGDFKGTDLETKVSDAQCISIKTKMRLSTY